MNYRNLSLALVALALVLYCRGPSAVRVVNNTAISADEGFLVYKDVRYEAVWGPEVTHVGFARFFERARYRPAPFFTHHVVVTTGDFADPHFVRITSTGGGNFIWAADRRPEGHLVALHLVPADRTVLWQLRQIDDGDRIELRGREEVDGGVEGSDGSYLRLNHDNHKYLLVTEAIRGDR